MRNPSSRLPLSVRRLFRLPLTHDRALREVDDELRFHFEMRVAEFRALGMSQADAEAEATRRFGDSDEYLTFARQRAERRVRHLALARWLSECAQDLRIALRQFRRSPSLGVVVVLTLALCIGATSAVYGVVQSLLLSPLRYDDGNRIVSVEARRKEDGDIRWQISTELFRLWAARARNLEDFAADVAHMRPFGADTAVHDSVFTGAVTPSFLPLLRVRPSLGRGFIAADAQRGAPAVALLGDSLWRTRFGGDPRVVGRQVVVDGVSRTIIGVVPPGVNVPVQGGSPTESFDVLLPLTIDRAFGVDAFARLRPGVTSTVASRELDAILRTLPDTGDLHGRRGEVRTPQDRVDPGRRHGVEVLFVAAAGLLLIACADIAGLLLMRGWARRREFAVRQALGADRVRLARQLIVESLLLALPGGALGLGVAWVALRHVRGFDIQGLESISAAPMLFWTIGISVSTALLFGIGPALLAWERSVDSSLRTGRTNAGPGRATGRAHAALVVAQIALSLLFLSAAGVLTRSFVALLRTPVGYEPDGLFDVKVRRQAARGRRLTDDESVVIMRTLQQSIAAMPGVSEVAVGALPLTMVWPGPTAVEGANGLRALGFFATGGFNVSRDYFRVARIQLERGRGFDVVPASAAREVIVNQALARLLWPDRDALGARMRFGDGKNATWYTVVGIARDVRMPGRAPDFFALQVYETPGSMEGSEGHLIVRARGDSATLQPLFARAIERAGVGVKLDRIMSAKSALEFVYRAPRLATAIFVAFTVLAVVLAAVGLFGIIAHAVARRTREIGIRMALGADPAALTRTIVMQSARLVVAGCAIGLVTAYAAGSALTKIVYGVSATDPVSLVLSVVLLFATALLASVVPVRRALRVDPMDTLRAE